ncbi:MAG: response regulator [Alcanivorax sp.]
MSKKTVLVVEDNDFVRMQICKFLNDEGYDTVESTDGQEALEIISGGADMAIVDVRMEPMSGFDFVRTLRSNDDDTPVIVITGDENSDILSEASKLDILAVLKKPVEKERLIKSVSRVLRIER